MKTRMVNKKGQEEMVGFAMIIVVVFIILLVFLWFFGMNRDDTEVKSREVESFVNSLLGYTTSCENYRYGNLNIEELIFYCEDEEICLDGKESCEVLNETLSGILGESFKISNESYFSGYELMVSVGGTEMVHFEEGLLEGNSRSGRQKIPKGGVSAEVSFSVFTKP